MVQEKHLLLRIQSQPGGEAFAFSDSAGCPRRICRRIAQNYSASWRELPHDIFQEDLLLCWRPIMEDIQEQNGIKALTLQHCGRRVVMQKPLEISRCA